MNASRSRYNKLENAAQQAVTENQLDLHLESPQFQTSQALSPHSEATANTSPADPSSSAQQGLSAQFDDSGVFVDELAENRFEEAEDTDGLDQPAGWQRPNAAGAEQATAEHTLDIQVESMWVSMPNGEQLHLRHFIPSIIPLERSGSVAGAAAESAVEADVCADTEVPTGHGDQTVELKHQRVFMLHGEVECGRIFYHESGRGLAWDFAKRGYEVFVADLGGRGRSLLFDENHSTLTTHDLVTEAIPRMLKAIAAKSGASNAVGLTRSGYAASIWVAHGFGAVLMSAAWARLSEAERCARQMIFFGARRQILGQRGLASAFVKLFCHPLTSRFVDWHKLFPATRLRLGSADENTQWFRTYSKWISSSRWIDDVDQFDYQAALSANPIPSALHIAAAADTVYAAPQDVRCFIEELGPHDAQMLVFDEIPQAKQRYNHLSMLMHPSANEDIFAQLHAWLAAQLGEPQSRAVAQPPSSAQTSFSGGRYASRGRYTALREDAVQASSSKKAVELCA